MFNVIIAGSRSFNQYKTLQRVCNYYLQNKSEVVVLCGQARGTDTLALRYAHESSLQVQFFPANWQKFGKSAGFLRNRRMVQNADALIAFWNGISPGTKSILSLAKWQQLKIRVHFFDDLFSSL